MVPLLVPTKYCQIMQKKIFFILEYFCKYIFVQKYVGMVVTVMVGLDAVGKTTLQIKTWLHMRPVIFENKNNFFNTLSRLLILFDSVLMLGNVLLHSALRKCSQSK